MKLTETTTEKNYGQEDLVIETPFLAPGKYIARLQYIVLCQSKDYIYYRCFFETNKRRISNGKRYTFSETLNGEQFKSIFYFENYSKFNEPIDKVFDIEIIREGEYVKLKSAVEIKYDENDITIPATKEDWTFYEIAKIKNALYIYFPDQSRKLFNDFLNEVENYEKKEVKKNKNKI